MPGLTGISHLDLTVSDAEKSAEWYVNTLELTRLMRADLGSRTMIVLLHPASRLIIGLNQHREQTAEYFDEHRPGLDHVGFAVAERSELDRWQERFADLGVTHSPVTDDPSGMGTALVFRDPDNIQLELWWARPRRGSAAG
ncbi:MAG TPA: VOC family protein [Mycobacterium sp.]|nr:VOC family protein [Mycobacterium sp.]